jgi:transcriptional regulator with XRE-family HTH domain
MKLSLEEKQMLGRVLVSRRSGLNLTQEKLCAESDVGIRTIQRAEKGGGISEENLAVLAIVFKCDAEDLIKEAKEKGANGPELRLKFTIVEKPSELLEQLRRSQGPLHIGPEGEHPFNEYVGGFILNLKSALADLPPKKKGAAPALLEEADYVLKFTSQMGFRLFACHYKEVFELAGKFLSKPTTLVIAAPKADTRIKKTQKGLILDYVMDSRKQTLTRILNFKLTPYDWMEDQLISKSNSEERVRAALAKIHSDIREREK